MTATPLVRLSSCVFLLVCIGAATGSLQDGVGKPAVLGLLGEEGFLQNFTENHKKNLNPATQTRNPHKPKNKSKLKHAKKFEGLFTKNRIGSSLRIPGLDCVMGDCPKPLDNEYMSFKQIEWYLQELSAKTVRMELYSIGKTIENRDIWMAKVRPYMVRNPINAKKTEHNATWIEAGIHAREWISIATATQIIHNLIINCTGHCQDDFYIVPVANPDGYEYSRTTDRFWVKNRADIPGSSCKGVDLNRNWDMKFDKFVNDNPCKKKYRGVSAFSEPETVALSQQMALVPNMTLFVSLQSYGEKVMYPWSHKKKAPRKEKKIKKVAAKFVKYADPGYEVIQFAQLSKIGGSSIDYAFAILRVRFSYTLLLRDSEGYELPSSEIVPSGIETLAGINGMISKIKKSFL